MEFWQRFIDFLHIKARSRSAYRLMLLQCCEQLVMTFKGVAARSTALAVRLYERVRFSLAWRSVGPTLCRIISIVHAYIDRKPIFRIMGRHHHTLASFGIFAIMFSLGFGFGVSTSQNFYIPLEPREVFLLAQNEATEEDLEGAPFKELNDHDVNAAEHLAQTPLAVRDEPGTHQVEVQRGDTLVKLLTRSGVTSREAYNLIAAVKPKANVRDLQVGQMVTLSFKPSEKEAGTREFAGLTMGVDGADLSVEKNAKGIFLAKKKDHEVARDVVYVDGRVKSSFLEATSSAGVPRHLMSSVVKSFASTVNFNRVRPGSTFEVVFERFTDKTNGKVKNGNILFAAVDNGSQKHCMYRHKCLDGQIRYLNQNGDISGGNTMVRPVDYCRVTSGYGMRLHPIKKRHIMHTGIDYAASVGKPVKSVWAGRVEYMGWRSGYGRCVDIRHSNGYLTRYAHLNNFAKGLYRGMSVPQAHRLGSVGSSGSATGPHLHFEIRDRRNNPLNPATNASFRIKLSDREMRRFKSNVALISSKINHARNQPEFANGKRKGAVKLTSLKAPEQLPA